MDELRERIARAIIGACGIKGPSEGLLRSARRQAGRVIKSLALEVESHPNVPISVPEFDAEGQPVMHEYMLPPVQKSNFEWVAKERWVTPWVEVGDRETSEQLSARLEANRT